jgi:hypothetical protein
MSFRQRRLLQQQNSAKPTMPKSDQEANSQASLGRNKLCFKRKRLACCNNACSSSNGSGSTFAASYLGSHSRSAGSSGKPKSNLNKKQKVKTLADQEANDELENDEPGQNRDQTDLDQDEEYDESIFSDCNESNAVSNLSNASSSMVITILSSSRFLSYHYYNI